MASPPQQQLASSRVNDAPSQEPIAKSVVVPRCSTWFSLEAINPIEKRMLPEFFVHETPLYKNSTKRSSSVSKTPQIYIKYRNFMVDAYRQQPHVYLTATACRRNLAGDACAILRVHEFLTHWGLINYSVPPHAMPPAIHANYALKPAVMTRSDASSSSSSSSSGSIAVLHDAKQTTPSSSWQCEACGVGAVAFELSAEAKRKATEANGNTSNGNTVTKEMALSAFCLAPGSGLCDECFLNRPSVFPEGGVDASDFVRVEAPAQWTPEETRLLLETVAASGRDSDESCDWNVIAAKIRSKTAEDCMLHFLELPILQQAGHSSLLGLGSGSGCGKANDVLQRPFEYAQAMNASVLDMSALVAQVDPFVARAAARAAIRAVQQLHTMPAMAKVAASVPVKSETASSQPAIENGDDAMNGALSLEQAAESVASSAVAAGIAVKSEIGANDVEMKSVADDQDASVNLLSKEVVAVAKEASGATAAALLAVRAHAIAEATANGPVRDLVTELLQNQLQQMELKMQQLSVLESAVAAEKDKLTQEKYQLYVDRLAFAQHKLNGGAKTAAAAL